MGKCGWRCMADTLTNVADELQPASITAGRAGKQKDKFLGVTEAMASAGSPPTFSAYSDTICLISAEQRPTIWPTELAVSRLCNHKGGLLLRPCTGFHTLETLGMTTAKQITFLGEKQFGFSSHVHQQGREKPSLRTKVTSPHSLLHHSASSVKVLLRPWVSLENHSSPFTLHPPVFVAEDH